MRSSPFFSRSLVVLFAIVLCCPTAATAQSEVPQLINLPRENFVPNGFIVYGKAPTQEQAGIAAHVHYRQTTDPLPDLEAFFKFGGTLELVTTSFILSKHAVVISEIMWGLDASYPAEGDDTYTQWIELYNPYSGSHFTPEIFLLFTPFKSYPDRDIVELPSGQRVLVLDTVSNLHLGRWDLPGRSGRRPFSNIVSAYRNIVYADDTTPHLHRSIVPFGSYRESWEATPERGRRNMLLSEIDDLDRVVRLPYVATPGVSHVSDMYLRQLPRTVVRSDRVVINEVRNDVSNDNLDWVELKNVSRLPINLAAWELSIVTGVNADIDLVDLPDYEIAPGEILLLQARHPKFTTLADGINIANAVAPKNTGAVHKYFVDPNLNLPNVGTFTLLLRSESDKNGQDVAIEDYAGNVFFSDPPHTDFWPRAGQPRPTEVADFGNYTSFGSLDSTWVRLRYQRDDGHHKDAWEVVGSQGGIGYAPKANLSISPGTPGYENTALKTRADDPNPRTPPADNEYTTGMISISEIMADPGIRRNKAQWIELYNSSLTEAVNLAGWILEIRNLPDDVSSYANGHLIFNDAVILPNQTLLLVSKSAPNNVPENRIYNLYDQHRHQLRVSNRRGLLLNPSGFYVKLTDKGTSGTTTDDIVVDQAGNLSVGTRELTRLWRLPLPDASVRLSLVRQYGAPFSRDVRDGVPDSATVGSLSEAWQQTHRLYISSVYYGNSSDQGTPGHRLGSPLPVELSSFHPKRTETGKVIISWSTESELDNAGFNILRSEHCDGVFAVINPTLIPGAGTSGEKHHYTFTDTTATPGIVYVYRLEDISLDRTRQVSIAVRLKGDISPTHKFPTIWGQLKVEN